MAEKELTKKPEAVAEASTLPDAEMEALACLWRVGKATAREVRETMGAFRPMTHGAMVTLLKRLESKGLVCKEKGPVGKAFVYEPTRRPEPTYRKIMNDLRERIFGGRGITMVASLFETNPPTAEELDTLQELLDTLRRKQRKG
jgi:BlaI family transcriptional regulator, penicillinase repressor